MTDQNASGIEEGDIVFECPHCGKSLAIDGRGAGMVIVCPDCQARVQVPEDAEAESAADAYGLNAAGDGDHLEEIGKELALIQAALDRMVAILQDVAAEKPSRRY